MHLLATPSSISCCLLQRFKFHTPTIVQVNITTTLHDTWHTCIYITLVLLSISSSWAGWLPSRRTVCYSMYASTYASSNLSNPTLLVLAGHHPSHPWVLPPRRSPHWTPPTTFFVYRQLNCSQSGPPNENRACSIGWPISFLACSQLTQLKFLRHLLLYT